MELKLEIIADQGEPLLATNRTIVELKPNYYTNFKNKGNTTNRTIVELKLPIPEVIQIPACYQSYHSGIETRSERDTMFTMNTPNRTIVELKR